MTLDDLPPGLRYDIEAAASFTSVTPEQWAETMLRRACDSEADNNPAYREIIDHKP